jgi:hypothetical protein
MLKHALKSFDNFASDNFASGKEGDKVAEKVEKATDKPTNAYHSMPRTRTNVTCATAVGMLLV